MDTAPSLFVVLIPACLGGVFALAGGILLFINLRTRRRARASQAWPGTPGKVRGTSLRDHSRRDANGDLLVMYEPVVEYEYTVGGAELQGRRLAFGAAGMGKNDAEQLLRLYSPGMEVTVYYDPANPAEAVLEREAKGSTLGVVLGGVFVGLGAVICVVGGALALFLGS